MLRGPINEMFLSWITGIGRCQQNQMWRGEQNHPIAFDYKRLRQLSEGPVGGDDKSSSQQSLAMPKSPNRTLVCFVSLIRTHHVI
ncbi:hypothetical protein AWB77_00524 [Caballeronia fortuita]|uniref:Uncharacterized protein n=1 Tax=Caballeronia fortuita TaxID=1777138 RepID=A0A157ZBX8_9BURK|nr:hypothetical protein AWB77_00524 [Caballeronia fortuita]